MYQFKKFIKRYFPSFTYFYQNLGYRIFIVILLSIFVGILDGFGLTMFLPLLQMADGGVATGEGMGNLQFLIDALDFLNISLTLKVALLILFVFFVLKGIAAYFAQVYRVIIQQFFIANLRNKLTHLFTRFGFKHFVSADIGKIQNTMTVEVGRVSLAFLTYINILQNTVLVIVYLGFLLMVDWQFTLMVGLGGFIANFAYSSIFKSTKKVSGALSQSNSTFQGFMIQFVQNFKYLKATGLLNHYENRLKGAIKEVEENNKKIGVLDAIVSSSREPILIGIVCLVILLQITVMGGSLATILVSLLFFYRALISIISLQKYYNNFLGFTGSISTIIDLEQELKSGGEQNGKERFNHFQAAIQLNDVDFGYQKDDLILKSINLNLPKNKSIALVGESGSGKTTLANLITGLLTPTEGKMLVDGKDISILDKTQFQSRIGYIAQEPVIFNDTIYNNITFWAEKTPSNKGRFEEAIRRASLVTFIQNLSEKENTLLGNNGINLSGGQKQRISIARELYKEIDILILDEATSALDSETEKEIQENIEDFKGDYTLLIIAHRLSTIKNVDMICLMDQGQIIEQANFEQLYQKNEKFKRMVALQEM